MEDREPPTFATLLRHFRLEAALSQERLAERARISAETIGALERGARRSPYRETVAMLSGALRLNPEDRARLYAAAARPQRFRRRRLLRTVADGAATLRALPEPDPHTMPPLTNLPLPPSIGSGGLDRERLALQVAEKLIDAWPDGAWLVEFEVVVKGRPVGFESAQTSFDPADDRRVLVARDPIGDQTSRRVIVRRIEGSQRA
jgi:transcriptional regulator with XRE-family HTH domain